MATVRQVFSDIKGNKPKIIKKKKNKYISGDKGVDWGKEDSCNFDQRDKQEDTTA